MPFVIQAVEKYGREATCHIVDAMHDLPQTEATVDWLISQLRRDYDLSDVEQENYCFRLAWALRKAPQPIFTKRFNDIITAKAFPEQLRQSLKERLDTLTWGWDRGWAALKYFGLDTRQRGFAHNAHDWGRCIVESLARHPEKADTVLSLLAGQCGGEDPCLMCWLRAWIIELAGAMRLTEAVPLLMDILESDHSCSASGALWQIGSDTVLRGIDARWRQKGVKLRRIMADLLTHLRGDHCIERALSFFKRERDQETKLTLAEALLENYYEDALDLASSLAEKVGEKKCKRREVDLRIAW